MAAAHGQLSPGLLTVLGGSRPAAASIGSGFEQPGPQPNAGAEQLLAEARTRLAAHRSISAAIQQQVNLYRQQLVGSGTYLQAAGETPRLRFELTLRVDDQVASFQQVCDGQYLWIRRQTQLHAPPDLGRVDLARVLSAAEAPDGGPSAGGADAVGGMPPALGWGGLPQLLEALDRAFEFATVSDGQFRGRGVHALRGQWKSEHLARWLPDQRARIEEGKPALLDKLPPALPDHVIVLLGRDDLFPYRIEYRRTATEAGETDQILVAIDLYDVRFDQPLDERLFEFEPGPTPWTDETDRYLRQHTRP
ncbi:MAG: hypothetical protein WD403_16735 [Pirellulales bacterium]